MSYAAILAAIAVIIGHHCAEAQPNGVRTVSVSGQAEIRLVPDMVVITLGVETFDMDLDVAKQDNDDRVTTLNQVAESLGVARQDFKTDFLSIEPQYQNRYDRGNFLRYVVRRSVVITLRDVSKFEVLLTSLLESGANYVHGIRFRTTKLKKHLDDARDLALEEASEKAASIARKLDQNLGGPHTIREQHSGWESSYVHWGQRRDRRMPSNIVQQAEPSAVRLDGPTQPGQISVTVNIMVSFLLVD
jgi:uncharacterized protein YggE